MSSLEITGLVAIILISAFAVVGIIVAIPIVRLVNRIRFLVQKLNESLVPVVEKLNNTVSFCGHFMFDCINTFHNMIYLC